MSDAPILFHTYACEHSVIEVDVELIEAFITAAVWVDLRGDDGDEVTASVGWAAVLAHRSSWAAVHKLVTDFRVELDERAETDATAAEAYALVIDDPAQAGHDLWLTMRHHGAGFWDRGNGAVGDLLAELAERLGSEDASVEAQTSGEEADAALRDQPPVILYYPM